MVYVIIILTCLLIGVFIYWRSEDLTLASVLSGSFLGFGILIAFLVIDNDKKEKELDSVLKENPKYLHVKSIIKSDGVVNDRELEALKTIIELNAN